MNGQAVYEAAKNCVGVTEERADGVSRLIFPVGSVGLRQKDGNWKQLDCPLTVAVPRRTERQRKLFELMTRDRLDFWTMRDFIHALGLRFSTRICGQIGKDLKAIGISDRKKVYGLFDARTKRYIPHCFVFSAYSMRFAKPRDIRMDYRKQAQERLAACQQMRSRG